MALRANEPDAVAAAPLLIRFQAARRTCGLIASDGRRRQKLDTAARCAARRRDDRDLSSASNPSIGDHISSRSSRPEASSPGLTWRHWSQVRLR